MFVLRREVKECQDGFSRRCFAGSEVLAGFERSAILTAKFLSFANVINATRTITFVTNFGSVSIFVFVLKRLFICLVCHRTNKMKLTCNDMTSNGSTLTKCPPKNTGLLLSEIFKLNKQWYQATQLRVAEKKCIWAWRTWRLIGPYLIKYKILSVTAGGGQHHGTCLNNLIRRKQKPEFDKFSSVGPLNWKCLRLVKIPCGFVGQSGRVRKTEDGVIQSRTRYHWLRWQVFESWTMYSANIFAVRTTVWNKSCITARMNLRSLT